MVLCFSPCTCCNSQSMFLNKRFGTALFQIVLDHWDFTMVCYCFSTLDCPGWPASWSWSRGGRISWPCLGYAAAPLCLFQGEVPIDQLGSPWVAQSHWRFTKPTRVWAGRNVRKQMSSWKKFSYSGYGTYSLALLSLTGQCWSYS